MILLLIIAIGAYLTQPRPPYAVYVLKAHRWDYAADAAPEEYG